MRRSTWVKLFILLVLLPGVIGLATYLTRTNNTRRSPAAEASARSGRPKVELDRTKLVSLATSGSQLNLKSNFALPAGSRLVAIVDNSCLANKPGTQGKALSEKAYYAAENDGPEDLKLQAYSFTVGEDYNVDQLVNDADSDECVLSVTHERTLKLVRPHSVVTSSLSQVTSATSSQQAHLDFLRAKKAWSLLLDSGHPITKDVVVAVVDSGVDYNHPDLATNMWRGPSGAPGYNFIDDNEKPLDDLNHGTHVAGLIGAIGNSVGTAGIMGRHIKIMSVKIIDAKDEGTLSNLINGIHFATDHGADIINMSLGGEGTSSAEEDAIRYATSHGVAVVVAAGNSGKNVTAATADYPAGYAPDVPGMIAVGAIDTATGLRTDYSNYSPSFVYIAAPGSENSGTQTGLLSTLPGSSYGRMEGTSMAAPIVSGALALTIGVMKSEGLPVNNADAVDVILSSARNDGTLVDSFKNGNVLDLERLAITLKYKFMIEGDAGAEDGP